MKFFSVWPRRAAVFGALWLALLAPSGAQGLASLSAHAEAGRAFDALRAARPDDMPRLAEVDGAAVLRVLTDAPRFLNAVSYSVNDIGALSDVCDRVRTDVIDYISLGALQNGQLVMASMARNTVTYQNEIALLQRFQAQCIAKQVPLAEALFRQMGEAQASRLRLGGLKRSQMALLQTYMIAASHCAVDAAAPAPYCEVLDTLGEFALVHARALSPDSRASVLALLTPLVARATPVRKPVLQRIVDAMTDTRCEGLCRLQSGT